MLIDKGELKLEETRTIVLDIYDYKLIINALNEFRNKKIAENVDTEIIDELIKKLLDAPIDKRKVKGSFAFER
jgi:6-pyruvoyl-tetrahydropterin synthase